MSRRLARASGDARGDQGAAVVWTLALIPLLLLAFSASAVAGALAVARQRVATAADVAVLAAAQALADPCAAADRAAHANGTTLVACSVEADDVTVTVSRPAPELVARIAGMLGGDPPDLSSTARAGPA